MTTRLIGFTRRALAEPGTRFNALMGLLAEPEGLRESFERQPGNKAPGVDGVRKQEYARGVERRLGELSSAVRRLGYRPQPVRRVYIAKSDGGRRPLGVPSFEDRIVQDRLSCILQAIWEPEFRECSYGFRPGRNAHQALARLGEIVTQARTQWVVEADIKGFFDGLSHEHLMQFLAHRIADGRLLRIVRRFLKAGALETGLFSATEAGTPQGGLVSPVLANIYLHYVLDLWFEKRYASACRGRAYLVRYADDFVACFEDEGDAKRFLPALQERLGQFSLQLEPTKTAVLRFGAHALWMCRRDGHRRAQTFNFLGFTHYVRRTRGGIALGRRTQRQRFGRKLRELSVHLATLRVQGGRAMMRYARRHWLGHLQYYAVSGNSRSLRIYFERVGRLLFKWLNRRSQRRSINWLRFKPVLTRLLPTPRILHWLTSPTPPMPHAGSRMV
jgi:group II intron reverse transcriptase/maturase